MDSGDSQLSTSLLSENQDPFNIRNQRDLLKFFFKAKKMMISFAIKKTFPFLETLRDHELITDACYEELQTNLRKDVPVCKVVYDALRSLEEKFDPKHLDILFNEIHLKEYPELHHIHESFREVVQNIAYVQDGNERDPLEGSAGPLSLEQGTSEHLQESLALARRNAATPNGTTLDANGVSDASSDTEEPYVMRGSLSSGERVALESGLTSNHCTQEPEKAEFCDEAVQVNNGDAGEKTSSPLFCAEQRVELSNSAIQSSSCFVSLTDIKKESPSFDSKEGCNQKHDIIEISSDELTDISGGEETPKASMSSRKRGVDATCLRKSSECRKRRQKRGTILESYSGSSGDEAPKKAKEPEDAGNKSNCGTDHYKREFNSEDSTELLIREEPQETCSSALRRGSGASRGQEAKTGHSRTSSMTDAVDSGGLDWRRKLVIKYKALQGKRPNNIKPLIRRKRGPRIRKDKNMNFDVPELPVTCGPLKGTLYKEKLKQGSSSKCILKENGKDWVTLREFEVEGGKEKCKNWRLSVRCGGWTLKELIEKDILPNPPRTKRKRQKPVQSLPQTRRMPSHPRTTPAVSTSSGLRSGTTQTPCKGNLYDPWPNNHNVCYVCGRSGTLYCCDSCPRSFHRKCHIQHINLKRDPWFCIFCSIKTIQENPSQNHYYQESEVLIRPMDYINKLKCQFILLKMYSYAKSSFFIQEPYHSRELLPRDPGTMCLNKVKDKLCRKKYLEVQGFVRDMRLIFENHKKFYKHRNIIKLGYQLEEEFEANFRDIFRIHCKEKSKN